MKCFPVSDLRDNMKSRVSNPGASRFGVREVPIHRWVYQDILFAKTSVWRWIFKNHIFTGLDNVYSEIPHCLRINLRETLMQRSGVCWTRTSGDSFPSWCCLQQNWVVHSCSSPRGELHGSLRPNVPRVCTGPLIWNLPLRPVSTCYSQGLEMESEVVLSWAVLLLTWSKQLQGGGGRASTEKDIYKVKFLKGQNRMRPKIEYLRRQMHPY